jgi:hypothetical protein
MTRTHIIIIVALAFVLIVSVIYTCQMKRFGMDRGTTANGTHSNAGLPDLTTSQTYVVPEGADTGQIEVIAYVDEDRVGADSEIFVYRAGLHEEPLVQVKDGIVQILEVGTFDVQVIYTDDSGMKHEKWIENLQLVAGDTLSEKVYFDFGQLAIDVGGAGTSYTASDISVEVYPPGETNKEVVKSTADSVIDLLDGKYDVKLSLDLDNKEDELWEKDVEIKPNETTRVEVNFSGGSLIIRLQDGKSLPGAKVAVYKEGETSNSVAEGDPGEELNVDPGKYDVLVTVGEAKTKYEYWEKGIEVKKGKTNRVDIKLPVGTIKVNAFSSGGNQIAGTEVDVYVYNKGETSDSILSVNGAETFTLEAGVYDLRVEYTNSQAQPSVWIRDVNVKEGEHQTLRADFSVTSITTTVIVGNEELPGDKVQIYYYREGSDDYSGLTISGQPAILDAGDYRIKVEWSGDQLPIVEWIGTKTAKSGESLNIEYKMNAGWAVFNTQSGELNGLSVENIKIDVSVGDKILLPAGVYFLRTASGESVTLDIGAGGTHEF